MKRLEAIARESKFDFIRIDLPLFSYMDSVIDKPYSYEALPYFYKDGHMSPVGTEIVAGAIMGRIRSAKDAQNR